MNGYSVWSTNTLTPSREQGMLSIIKYPHFRSSLIGSSCMTICSSSSPLADLPYLCQHDQLNNAIEIAENAYLGGHLVSKDSFYILLQCCKRLSDIHAGHRVLSLMTKCRLEASPFLGYHLICLFSCCGSLREAYRIFTMIPKPNLYTFHSIILACIKFGEYKLSLEIYRLMQEVGLNSDKFLFSSILCSCNNLRSIVQGMLIHDQIVRCGFHEELIVGNALIDMYSKCRFLDEACKVFGALLIRDTVSWSSLIGGYIQHDYCASAIDMYENMQVEGINPSKVTFLYILNACCKTGEVKKGKMVHDQVLKGGCDLDVCVSTALIDMYAKCGSLEDAWTIFVKLGHRDVVVWGTMITAFSQNGENVLALQLFAMLMTEELEADVTCFSSALKACSRLRELKEGRLIHVQIYERMFERALVVGSSLVDMYANCGNLEDAQRIFQVHPNKDVVLYGTIISGYAQKGDGICALKLYTEMQAQNINPNKLIYSCVLKACSSTISHKEGQLLHDQVLRAGFESDVVVGSSIVDMYAKCSNLLDACKVFDDIKEPDLISWGAIIVGFAQCGQGHLAHEYFRKMLHKDIDPDTYVFTGLLKACGIMRDVRVGRYVHSHIIESGYELDDAVLNSLVDMYVKCINLDEALLLFERMPCRHAEAWGSIISGYVFDGHSPFALHLLCQMQQENVEVDELLFSLILRACGSIGAISEGLVIHFLVVQSGTIVDTHLGNSLIHLYCKCGQLDDAGSIFDKLQSRNEFSWGTLVTGYAHHGESVHALVLFQCMCENGIKPTKSTLSSLLKACGTIGAIEHSILIHNHMVEMGFESDIILASSLVDTYAKCGSLEEAQRVFDNLSEKDLISWGALIAGYAHHGNYKLVEKCLHTLQLQGLKPNDVIFTSILAACNHAGLVQQGCFYFKSMVEVYRILPSIEQYSCMVDLLGRLGSLNEAECILQTMAATPDHVLWASLLNNSERHCNLGLGSMCFDQMMKLIPCDGAGYVSMLNLHVEAQAFEENLTEIELMFM